MVGASKNAMTMQKKKKKDPIRNQISGFRVWGFGPQINMKWQL